jgi:uncharacterized protein (DUF1697 family)
MPLAMRFAALLRGVNVGRGNRVAMADLRVAVATCGYTDVGTVLASGNVVFTAPSKTKPEAIALRLEKALLEELSLRVRVTVVDAATIAAVIKSAPKLPAGAEGSRLLAAFPRVPRALATLRPLAERDWSPATLTLGRHAAWLWCPGGVLTDKLFEETSRLLGDGITTRNWNTLLKLQAALAATEGKR